jgi:MFS family permease
LDGIGQEDIVDAATSQWRKFWADWREGLRYVSADSLLRNILLASGIFGPLLQVWILTELHAGADVLGLMVTATGIGTLIVGLVLGQVSVGPRLGFVAAGGQILFGIFLFATFLARNNPLVVALSALVGFAMATAVGFGTLVQARTEDRYRGRVIGANGTTRALLLVIGEAGGSLVVGQIGLMPVLDTACAILVVGGLLGILLLPRAAARVVITASS